MGVSYRCVSCGQMADEYLVFCGKTLFPILQLRVWLKAFSVFMLYCHILFHRKGSESPNCNPLYIAAIQIQTHDLTNIPLNGLLCAGGGHPRCGGGGVRPAMRYPLHRHAQRAVRRLRRAGHRWGRRAGSRPLLGVGLIAKFQSAVWDVLFVES